MISRVCVGDGGMPGFGSTVPTIWSLKCLAKLGHDSWNVTILAPANGAIFASHSRSFAVSLASNAARFESKVALPEGSSSASLALIARATTRPFSGSVQ